MSSVLVINQRPVNFNVQARGPQRSVLARANKNTKLVKYVRELKQFSFFVGRHLVYYGILALVTEAISRYSAVKKVETKPWPQLDCTEDSVSSHV